MNKGWFRTLSSISLSITHNLAYGNHNQVSGVIPINRHFSINDVLIRPNTPWPTNQTLLKKTGYFRGIKIATSHFRFPNHGTMMTNFHRQTTSEA